MKKIEYNRIGRGVYTLAEAQRLIKVPRRRIRRWAVGYKYTYKNEKRFTSPIVATGAGLVDGIASIDFSDLIEIRFLDAFRKHGVSWKAIHIAAERAKDLIGKSHPFSSNIFKTDGRTILAEIIDQSGDKTLLDLVKDQYAFEKIISPFLYKGIEFNQTNEPERWWPLGFKKSVVLDPHRSFGAPITATGGVPTSIINRALKSENSIEAVADWYDISLTEVKDAIYFEREFLAA